MEFIAGLVTGVAATIWFWPILALLIIGLWVASETLSGWWSLVATAIVGYLIFIKWPGVYDFVSTHITLSVGAYVLVAIVWSFFKFRQLVQEKVVVLQKLRNKCTDKFNLSRDYFSLANRANMDPTMERDFIDEMRKQYGDFALPASVTTIDNAVARITPQADNSKKALFMWAVYWPFSFVSFFIKDMVKTLAEEIYARLGKTYQRLADSMFRNAL